YLEEQGLIHPKRTRGGYRLFDEDTVERLRTILRLQRDEFLPLRVIRQELASPEANKARRRRRAAGPAGPEEGLNARELQARARRAGPGALAAPLVARPSTAGVSLMAVANVDRLKALIRDVPDWPEPGVVFRDIMPLLANADALRETIDLLGDWAAERSPDI